MAAADSERRARTPPSEPQESGPPIPALIGNSPAMQHVYRLTRQVARSIGWAHSWGLRCRWVATSSAPAAIRIITLEYTSWASCEANWLLTADANGIRLAPASDPNYPRIKAFVDSYQKSQR